MARPRKYDDRVSTAVRLPRDLHAKVRAAADEREISVNLFIENAIRRRFEAMVLEDRLRESFVDRAERKADAIRRAIDAQDNGSSAGGDS